jgi:benzoylformate decarboxylase
MRTVRDVTFEVLRHHGLTTIFANPGSTEVSFLVDLPADFRFVLGLHEGSVVGMATGYALGSGRPALVQLHTTAGLGNAVGALATARVNRAPLVVLVGQQDRRHLALEPFLTGRLDGLAGDYPVWTSTPLRAQDVPSAVSRAYQEAVSRRGPALVIVPMDDWAAPCDAAEVLAAPVAVSRAAGVSAEDVAGLVSLVSAARSPALVVGAGADSAEVWSALIGLAERLGCPVWQESFGARAGFPQDHRQFAGHLPAGRSRLRNVLSGHDLVLAIGAPAFRQYPYEPGSLADAGTQIAVLTDDPAEAHHSAADLAVVAPLAAAVAAVASSVAPRPVVTPVPPRRVPPSPPAPGEPLRAAHVFAALAGRLPADTVVVEECPSSRPDLHALIPARAPLGFLSAAMGGLGFAVPAAAGVRLAVPDRPVVALVGDGSSLYAIQALWSAARYGCGVLFVVLANGRYAVMDRLAEGQGGKPPWPSFTEVSVSGLATALGCPARRIESHDALLAVLDEVVPTLASRDTPLVLDIAVVPDSTFQP